MEIVCTRPPNFDEIVAAFPLAANGNVIFCYGSRIHNPFRCSISNALMEHESVHSERHGTDPAGWWRRYIDDIEFRFEEELLAHAGEYVVASHGLARPGRRFVLRDIAKKLAHPLYGSIVTADRAAALLKRAAADHRPRYVR